MTGSIELTPDGKHLLIRFPYREDLVEEVRVIPGRRWDRAQKVWRAPVAQLDNVVGAFMKHGFELTSDVTGLLAGTIAGEAANGSDAPAKPNAEAKLPLELPDVPALTVGLLNERVRHALHGAFPEPVWVVGEVFGLDKSQGRQHLFFQLVEKKWREARPHASIDIALFERTLAQLKPKLELADAALSLRDGIEIRALVRVDLYPPTGRFQAIIEDIDPSFTLGKMALSREQILAHLQKLGLTDRNTRLSLPTPALRIGVLTSPDSDGWTDFHKQLESSGVGFEVSCFPIKVQGAALKPTLLRGLAWFAERSADFDVLCILRGGGAKTDLAWFDDRDIALAVAKHPLKILCGIGHERDQSVLDAISHSEKTPTAVGAFLIQSVQSAAAALDERCRRLSEQTRRGLRAEASRLEKGALALQRSVQLRLHRTGDRLMHGTKALHQLVRRRLERTRDEVRSESQRLVAGTRMTLQRGRHRESVASERLRSLALLRLEQAGSSLQHRTDRQRLLDPERVLARGYALVRGPDNGSFVKSVRQVRAGADLEIILRDGRIRARAEHIDIEPASNEQSE